MPRIIIAALLSLVAVPLAAQELAPKTQMCIGTAQYAAYIVALRDSKSEQEMVREVAKSGLAPFYKRFLYGLIRIAYDDVTRKSDFGGVVPNIYTICSLGP